MEAPLRALTEFAVRQPAIRAPSDLMSEHRIG
jgi:hypothetical protein